MIEFFIFTILSVFLVTLLVCIDLFLTMFNPDED